MEYFTIKRPIFLVPSNDCYEEFKKIDKFMMILEKSGIGRLIKDKGKNLGRTGYNVYNLVTTIIYCFSKFQSSVREIEQLCKFDLRVMYLMGQQEPSHNTVKECINKYILPYTYEIFTTVIQTIIDEFNSDISDEYLDGTKIEANANKYKFVWKPTKFHKKLDIKIKDLLIEIGIEYKEKELIISFELNEILKEYVIKEKIDINNIPNGKVKEELNHKEIIYNSIDI